MIITYYYTCIYNTITVTSFTPIYHKLQHSSTCQTVLPSPSRYTGTALRSSTLLVHTTASSAYCYEKINDYSIVANNLFFANIKNTASTKFYYLLSKQLGYTFHYKIANCCFYHKYYHGCTCQLGPSSVCGKNVHGINYLACCYLWEAMKKSYIECSHDYR